MESASKILAIAISCTLGSVSQIEAQEEKPHQPDRQQQDVSPEQQEENKDIPTITNPAVFDEKDLDKLLEKQREYVKNIIRITELLEKARNRIILIAVTIRSLT